MTVTSAANYGKIQVIYSWFMRKFEGKEKNKDGKIERNSFKGKGGSTLRLAEAIKETRSRHEYLRKVADIT